MDHQLAGGDRRRRAERTAHPLSGQTAADGEQRHHRRRAGQQLDGAPDRHRQAPAERRERQSGTDRQQDRIGADRAQHPPERPQHAAVSALAMELGQDQGQRQDDQHLGQNGHDNRDQGRVAQQLRHQRIADIAAVGHRQPHAEEGVVERRGSSRDGRDQHADAVGDQRGADIDQQEVGHQDAVERALGERVEQ